MSQATIETYVQRAKRLGLNPTEVCIACGSADVDKSVVGGHRWCKEHVDWETATAAICQTCRYEVGLTCDKWRFE
jgi:hypothetical protein